MPALFIFLFKVNVALLLFCAGYYLVLRHLTFYTLNRVYLVTAIVFASIYPKIDLTAFAQKHENIVLPVQTVVLNWKAPAQELVKPVAQSAYWQWASLLFWAGAAILGIRLLIQLFSLLKLYRNSKPANLLDHDVRLISGEAAPFSFWRSIYVNPDNHTPADLEAILMHEQVHVNGLHTIDILLAELSSIFYWFNPGIWLIKKAVRENIEFITDRKILNKGIEAKAYQYSLVNVSFNATTPGIVNHFNISTIKKRIIMMNAKRSSRFKLTRYVFVVPAVVTLLLVFTLSKADVTKPIKLQLTKAIKPVASAIKQVALSVIPKKDTLILKKVITVIKDKKGNADTLKDTVQFAFATYQKVDTGKRIKLIIKDNNIAGPTGFDSLNYVLNGKKVSSGQFRNLNPNQIVSINIVNTAEAKKILGDNIKFDNDNKVLFITTSDSEAGKKLAVQLGNKRQLTNIRITTTRAPGAEVKELRSDTSIAIIGKGVKGVTYYERPVETVSVTGMASPGTYKNLATTKTLTGIGKSSSGTYVELTPTKEVTVTGRKLQHITLDSAIINEVLVIGKQPASVKDKMVSTIYRSAPFKYTESKNAGGTTVFYSTPVIDRIADKLVFIDGKEATEKDLKKLSAFDINKMTVSSDADTVKKYGGKAKNGVVYIYTRKEK